MRQDSERAIAGIQIETYFAAPTSSGPVGYPFAANVTYEDPLTEKPLTGEAIFSHVQHFQSAFEVLGTIESPRGVAVEWRLPELGDGGDVVSIYGGEIVRVKRYFDPTRTAGDVAPSGFGLRVHMGRAVRPGAFSLTSFHLNSEEELDRLADLGGEIE